MSLIRSSPTYFSKYTVFSATSCGHFAVHLMKSSDSICMESIDVEKPVN